MFSCWIIILFSCISLYFFKFQNKTQKTYTNTAYDIEKKPIILIKIHENNQYFSSKHSAN